MWGIFQLGLDVYPFSSLQKLQDHLARFSGQYDQLVAFKPTGWTFSQQVESVEDIQPEVKGAISIYGTACARLSYFAVICPKQQEKQFLNVIQRLVCESSVLRPRCSTYSSLFW